MDTATLAGNLERLLGLIFSDQPVRAVQIDRRVVHSDLGEALLHRCDLAHLLSVKGGEPPDRCEHRGSENRDLLPGAGLSTRLTNRE